MLGNRVRALAGLICMAAAGCATQAPAPLTAEQIVEHNAEARGGLDAWRSIQTMVWTGRIESGSPPTKVAKFVLEFKRPNKSRFEVNGDQENSIGVFDGTRGWRESTMDGAPRLRRFSTREVRSAREAQGIDGLLIDHRANGIEVALGAIDQVDGRRAYRLKVTLPSGSTRQVWVDAQTFLELRYDRPAQATRSARAGAVSVYIRKYQTVEGLRMPQTIEVRAADGSGTPRSITVDEVTLNPSLSDAHFERPPLLQPRRRVPSIQASVDP